LTTKWPNFFQGNFKPPETIDEAVERLMMILDGEQKIALATMTEEDLIDLHFSLGMAIRNAFGLHKPGGYLLADCDDVHPDDASGMIIEALRTKLTKEITQWIQPKY